MSKARELQTFQEVWRELGDELARLPIQERIIVAARLSEKSEVLKRGKLLFASELMSLAAVLLVEKH